MGLTREQRRERSLEALRAVLATWTAYDAPGRYSVPPSDDQRMRHTDIAAALKRIYWESDEYTPLTLAQLRKRLPAGTEERILACHSVAVCPAPGVSTGVAIQPTQKKLIGEAMRWMLRGLPLYLAVSKVLLEGGVSVGEWESSLTW